MAEIGSRVRVFDSGLAPDLARGFVIGHRGQEVIVALDQGGDDWIGPDHSVRTTGQAKPIIRKPGGAVIPLSRERPRYRTRKAYGGPKR